MNLRYQLDQLGRGLEFTFWLGRHARLRVSAKSQEVTDSFVHELVHQILGL
jgi:hypothetical protein